MTFTKPTKPIAETPYNDPDGNHTSHNDAEPKEALIDFPSSCAAVGWKVGMRICEGGVVCVRLAAVELGGYCWYGEEIGPYALVRWSCLGLCEMPCAKVANSVRAIRWQRASMMLFVLIYHMC